MLGKMIVPRTALQRIVLLGVCAVAFFSSVSWLVACQVPVFRYALERWLSDKYEVIVLHDGPMNASTKVEFDKLSEQVDMTTNAIVRAVDVREQKDPSLHMLWKKQAATPATSIAIFYPQGAQEVPDRLVEVVPFHESTAHNLFDSPVRREITKRLVGGQSAVWIFVPSGNAEKDRAARDTLDAQLADVRKKLKLPVVEELEAESLQVQEQVSQLKIEFSSVTVKRDDIDERYLLKMLLESESDLAELNEPMAFPVFGRGRVLYALVGKGINQDMIYRACEFIVGPCSCQVKAQNPGFDLLTRLDWEVAVGDIRISDPLPDSPSEPVLLQIPTGRKSK